MLFKKLLRTACKYKSQFISMVIMIAIGVGVFVGFNMEWVSLEHNANKYFEETCFADFRIYSETGFDEEDIDSIKNIEGIEDASRYLNVTVDVKDNEDLLSLNVLEDYVVSKMYVVEGEGYNKESEGFWLSDSYAKKNNIKLDDKLTILYRNIEITAPVIGLVKSSEHAVCVADENQLMPDFSSFGFVYATPNMIFNKLGFTYYPQINILSDMSKEKIEDKISNSLNMTILVLSNNENVSYQGIMGEVEEGQTMGAILPCLFLAIGFLTMITTMHRITANEKVQIGTLKALGFKDRKILWHYTTYGLFIGIVGCVLGVILGFGIAGLIVSPNGMMSTYIDTPYWDLILPWWSLIILVVTLGLLTLICSLSVKKMLRGTAAEALRPYTPKKMKAIMLEKLKLFNKLSFITRWNLRDIFRHKTRSAMTLLGVVGCMLLLVGGLGMKDSMSGFMDIIDDTFNYKTRINLTEDIENETAISLTNSYNGDWVSESSVSINGKTIALEIYDIKNNLMRFVDSDAKITTINSDGAYICNRLAKDYNVGDVISISPYGCDKEYKIKIVGILTSTVTENIVMNKEYANYIGIDYKISSIFTNEDINDIASNSYISGKQTKLSIMESYDSFMEVMNLMVLLFVAAAVVLGIVVLYNLGVMSYTERYKELSTLKVVGFDDKKVGKILISQNIWLTILGIIIGLPLGVLVLKVLLITLAKEYELKLTLGALTYIVSLAVTLGVSLLVSIIIAKKNKKIDMVEALKGRE